MSFIAGWSSLVARQAHNLKVARKPNEHQKDTKYSKSNLAWFVKNHTREELEKNKRFVKDLKRYYRDFDELLTQVNLATK